MHRLIPYILAALSSCPTGGLFPPADTAALDTAPDDTASMGDCESGICPLEVSDAWADCGEGEWKDPPELSATPAGPGALDVVLLRAQEGCCPTVLVTAELHLRGSDPYVEAFVDLSQDDCECVCLLDVGFHLSEIPAGTWSVRVMGSETTATVD